MSEQIKIGRKYRIVSDVAERVWDRISFWTHASDVEFNDGQTAQEKLGSIKGITTSTDVVETGYATDATVTSRLNNDLDGFKFHNIGAVNLVAQVSDDSFYTDSDGNYILAESETGQSLIDDVTYKSLPNTERCYSWGADSVSPFKHYHFVKRNGVVKRDMTLADDYLADESGGCFRDPYHHHSQSCYRTWYFYEWTESVECYIHKKGDSSGAVWGETDCGKTVTWEWGSAQSADHNHKRDVTKTGGGWTVRPGSIVTGTEQRIGCGYTEGQFMDGYYGCSCGKHVVQKL